MLAKSDDLDHVGRIADGTIAQGRIKPAEQVSRKEGAGHNPPDAPDGLLASETREIQLEAKHLVKMSGDLLLLQGPSMDAVPVHHHSCFTEREGIGDRLPPSRCTLVLRDNIGFRLIAYESARTCLQVAESVQRLSPKRYF
jgi:hypothetical protein